MPLVVGADEESGQLQVVFLIGEEEYDAATRLPAFVEEALDETVFRVTFVHANADDPNDFPGLIEALAEADLLVMSVRRRAPPQEQLDALRSYLRRGQPLVALRTSSHAFALRSGEPPEGHDVWEDFDEEVLGGRYDMHYANRGTKVTVVPGAENHPILSGIEEREFQSPSRLYRSRDLAPESDVLLWGEAVEDGETVGEPVAWAHRYRGGRIFYTSMGHPGDFELPVFRHMLINAIRWAAGLPVREERAGSR